LSPELFKKALGYSNLDDNNYNAAYNIISLNGYNSQTTLISLAANDATPLGTWKNIFTRIYGQKKSTQGQSNQ
jgi:hypothetical protein